MSGDFTIGEFESAVRLVCPVCGPMWDYGIGGLTLTAVRELAGRHWADRHVAGLGERTRGWVR